MSRTKSAFWGVVSSQLFMVISILVNLFSTPFIVKGLDVEVYGLSIIIFQITSYLGQFDFGLSAGVSRYLAGQRGEDKDSREQVQKIISTSFIVYAIMGLIVAIVGVILAPFAVSIFKIDVSHKTNVEQVISAVCVLVGLQFLLRSISGIFFAHQRQVLSNTLSFILMLSNTAFVLLFIYEGNGLWSFIYAQGCSFIVNAGLNVYFFRKYYKHISLAIKQFDFSLLKQMFSYGFYLFLNGIAVQIVFQTDRVLVGSIISLTAVSVYSLTTRMPELVLGLIWRISENSFPGMVELSKNENLYAFKRVHDNIMRLSLTVSSIGFWLILLASYPFIKLWVGEQFYSGLHFLIIVCILYLFQHTFIHVTAVCLNGAGIVKGFSIMGVFEAILNLVLSIILTKVYGIKGTVMGTIIAGCLTSVWYVPYVAIKHKHFKLSEYLLTIIRPIFICSIFGIITFYFLYDIFMKIDTWFKLIYYTASVGAFLLIPFFIINKNLLQNLKYKIIS